MNWFKSSAILTTLCALALVGGTTARSAEDKPMHADPASVKWFREAKFGMFVHWGVYSTVGRGEWVMQNEGIPITDYEKLPARFNPSLFNAREWVSMVKDAGIKYITITSKHHDGFAMFDTQLNDWSIVKRTPFKRDPLKELADECHRHGIKLFFYYSQLDWHHTDYFPRGGTGLKAGRPNSGDWEKYKAFYLGQVKELCTNYGEIGGVWFDGWWDRPQADWAHDELYPMIHRLQPRALVGNNHHHKPFAGEDFQMFEQDLPGQNTAGFNKADPGSLPFETCRTINNSWGLNRGDQSHKSVPELIQYLVQAAGRDANLLLNTGPLPNGEILPEHRDRYLAMGSWLKVNGDSIYRTRGGPFRPAPWGVSTYRGKKVFLHVLNWPAGGLVDLPNFSLKVRKAGGLLGGKVEVAQTTAGTKLTLPATLRDPIDSIFVLDLETSIDEAPVTEAKGS